MKLSNRTPSQVIFIYVSFAFMDENQKLNLFIILYFYLLALPFSEHKRTDHIIIQVFKKFDHGLIIG